MIDLVIVGAGAAGISAGREASLRGLSFTLLEASQRAGGRAHTVDWQGHHLDLGAGWLHSADRNPLVRLAEQSGFAVDRVPAAWRGQYRDLGFSTEDRKAAYEAFSRFNTLVSRSQDGDVAAGALAPNGSWNAFIDALSGYLNGTSLKNMSAEDYAAYWDASSDFNWRLPNGYGELISELARSLPIAYGFAARQIEWDAEHVRVSSERGSVVAKRAIVTVGTAILARGAIRFLPSVDDHLDAAAQLPLGHVEKMFFHLESADEFPNDAHLIGNPRSNATGSYSLRPMGMPVLEGFFGGDWVASSSFDDIESLAREELGRLLGSGFRKRLRRIAHSSWRDDLRFGGSYSFARPGRHTARARLAIPVDDRLAFAGEACSSEDYSTVHGAWESGIAAVASLFGHSGQR